jgi:hypothetical protein
MKSVTSTLLLCLCIVGTSRTQIGIQLRANGDVGIGDSTPYTRLTLSGPVGYNNGTFPMHYMFENGNSHPVRAIFSHSPLLPDKGLFYYDSIENFRFGKDLTGIWFDIDEPAVGIGVADPFNSLIVAGNSDLSPAILRIGNSGSFDQTNSGALIFDEDISAALAPDNFCGIALRYNGATNRLDYLGDCANNTSLDNALLIMSMSREGNIGFGTAPDSIYRLQVAGDMRVEEIIVETGWADFVFDDAFVLRPLAEVESFIRANGHLPDIPTGVSIESNGLSLGDISARFMQKIEELTLYTIDQEKRLETQDEQIAKLLKLTLDLKTELAEIRKELEE